MSSGDGGCGSGPLPLGPQRAPWPGPHATSRELPDLDSSSGKGTCTSHAKTRSGNGEADTKALTPQVRDAEILTSRTLTQTRSARPRAPNPSNWVLHHLLTTLTKHC